MTTSNIARTTQSKFMAAVAEIAKVAKLDFIHNPKAANTGEIRLEAFESFKPVITLQYSFHAGYANFTGCSHVCAGQNHVPFFKLDEVLDGIRAKLI